MDASRSITSALADWLSRPTSPLAVRYVSQTFAVIGSARGRVRAENQDRVFAASYFNPNLRENFRAFVACDGLGGMDSGGQCASHAAATFIVSLMRSAGHLNREARLLDAVEEASREVFRVFHERGGTTLSAILLAQSGATAVSVGDTRIYEHDLNGNLKQLSKDDTIAEQVRAFRRDPLVDVDPSIGKRLAQVVGQASPLHPQIFDVSRLVVEKSKADTVGRHGVLITTDGIHDLGEGVVASLSRGAGTARELVSRLISVSDWVGGVDNASGLYVAAQNSTHTAEGSAGGAPFLQLFDATGDFHLAIGNYAEVASYKPLAHVSYPAQPSYPVRQPNKGKVPSKSKKKERRQAGRKGRSASKTRRAVQSEFDIEITEHSE